jgi:hypothetical protein
MAGAGKKTFTAGEILTASDTNTYLMEQTVMYFAGTAARASAIPTPSTGMTSYIGTTGTASIPQIETYTGSAWQTPYGLTQVANVSLSAITNHTISNVFTSQFANYRVVITGIGSLSQDLFIRMATTGTPDAGSNYGIQIFKNSGGTLAGTSTGSATRFESIAYENANLSTGILEIYQPQLATATGYQSIGGRSDQLWIAAGRVATTTVYDGINFTTGSGSFTGTVRIYGYRNS